MILTTEALAAALQPAKDRQLLAIDTEFVWERTYYPRLGLIQLSFSREECFLVDALAVTDLSPLGQAISDPGIQKIIHDPQQDLTILHQASGALPRNVFDTRSASGFVGLGCTISLKDVAAHFVGATLDNGQTRSNWVRRPLSDEQMKYAAEDVRYLPEIRDRLLETAALRGRDDWITAEMTMYDDPKLYLPRPIQEQYERVKGARKLSGRRLAALRELAAWRERQAQADDLPRGFVIPDEGLVELASRRPRNAEDLSRLKCRKDAARHTEAILEVLARASQIPADDHPRFESNPPLPEALGAQVDLLLAYTKGKSLAEDVDPQLLGTRADITSLVADGSTASADGHALLQGWRREFIGNDILALLSGEGAVELNPATGLPRLVARS